MHPLFSYANYVVPHAMLWPPIQLKQSLSYTNQLPIYEQQFDRTYVLIF